MNNIYYSSQQNIPTVNRSDEITGSVDKWEAHEKGILHRAFTGIIVVDNNVVLQHRKHPVFDGYFDLSFSSHPIVDGSNKTEVDWVLDSLLREWHIHDRKPKITLLGSVYYQANDTGSNYKEHEIDRVYRIELLSAPEVNYQYAYGMSLCPLEILKKPLFPLYSSLAPWVRTIFEKKII